MILCCGDALIDMIPATTAQATRSFTPQNDRHRQFWTNTYPTVALFPMAAWVREARAQRLKLCRGARLRRRA